MGINPGILQSIEIPLRLRRTHEMQTIVTDGFVRQFVNHTALLARAICVPNSMQPLPNYFDLLYKFIADVDWKKSKNTFPVSLGVAHRVHVNYCYPTLCLVCTTR